MDTLKLFDQRITGVILITGTVTFFVGASIPPLTGLTLRVWSAPWPEYLELIGAHRMAWLWTNGFFVVSVPLTVVGFGLLTDILGKGGGHLFAKAGLLLFVLGAILWLTSLAFRLNATVWAAQETVRTSVPPPGFEAVGLWVDTLFFIYMVLAYVSTATYGGALLQSELWPNWLGWVTVGAGIFGVVSFVTGLPSILSIPAGVQLIPLLIGVFLLLQRQ